MPNSRWLTAALLSTVVGVLAAGGSATNATAATVQVPVAAASGSHSFGPDAVMDDYAPRSFAAAAATLSPALIIALKRDLGQTAEQYLAEADAAVDAAAVVESLGKGDVEVLGSRLEGTELVVNVGSSNDAPLVEAAGATAELGEPVVPKFDTSGARFRQDLSGGEAYFFTDDIVGYRCSIGFNGFNLSSGSDQFATAGHCTTNPVGNGGYYDWLSQAQAGDPFSNVANPGIGQPVSGSFALGGGYDAGLVNVDATLPRAWNPQPRVVTWQGGAGTPTTFASVLDRIPATVGAPICKSGATSGWTCGQVLAVDESVNVQGDLINSIVSDMCILSGDSGGPALIGGAAVGINSWSTADCTSQGHASGVFPMISSDSTKATVQKLHGGVWEPAVVVNVPTVSVPAPAGSAAPGSNMSGSLANGNIRHSVEVFFDGSSTPRTASVSTAGTWSLSLTGLASGSHSYTTRARWGQYSESALQSGTFTVPSDTGGGGGGGGGGTNPPPTIEVDRIFGANRYATGVEVSQAAFPGTAPVVYIAGGENFPDGLSAAPAATKQGGPLLLTPAGSLPTIVKTEIQRLSPSTIVVVGGTGAVSGNVFKQLSALVADPVERLAGANRYATSRAVVKYAWPNPGTSQIGYVASGANFPDALSASAAAGSIDAPVILVPGASTTLDAATKTLIDQSLDLHTIKIAGGTGAVSAGIASSLATIGSVVRLGGADRFATSQLINSDAFPPPTVSDRMYLATGYQFPDALAGAVIAGLRSAPLYTVKTSCVPAAVIDAIGTLSTTKITLLGGTGVLTSAVEQLAVCP